jgi:hypothetical protein
MRDIVATIQPEQDELVRAALELISSGANFLGITKKDLVAEAVQFYLDARREEMRERMRTLMRQLDGTRAARVALLAGLSRDQLDAVGGVDERA